MFQGFVDMLVMSPVDAKAAVTPRKTPAAEFWALVDRPGGAERAAQMFHDARKRDAKAVMSPENPVNLLGYGLLQSGRKEEAVELFRLNAEAYPDSANAEDGLSDGYLAVGKTDLALAAEEKCIELLPADTTNNAQFKSSRNTRTKGLRNSKQSRSKSGSTRRPPELQRSCAQTPCPGQLRPASAATRLKLFRLCNRSGRRLKLSRLLGSNPHFFAAETEGVPAVLAAQI